MNITNILIVSQMFEDLQSLIGKGTNAKEFSLFT